MLFRSRSPVAEGILRHLSENRFPDLFIDSAGLIDTHKGENPDPRSIANAKRNGVDISLLVSRPLSESDLLNFDSILVMDRKNLDALKKFNNYRNAEHKILPAGYFLDSNNPPDIPDPYYGEEKDFQLVFDMLQGVVKAWLEAQCP